MSGNENQQTIKLAVRLFDAKEVGRSLTEVAVDIVKNEDKEVESRWFHSSKDADFFIWKDHNKNIIKQQLSFCGQLMEWNIIEGIRTGYIIEDASEKAAESVSKKVKSSALIRYDAKLQRQTAEQCIDIVGHIPGLKDQDKIQIINNFTNSPVFSQMLPEDIMKRYGLHNRTQSRPSVLTKILKLLGLLPKSK